jgi:hypothetical protein
MKKPTSLTIPAALAIFAFALAPAAPAQQTAPEGVSPDLFSFLVLSKGRG